MSKRVTSKNSVDRDYAKMLKDYFGFHLCGLEVTEEGCQKQVQVVYEDFKHIDTVRRELAQMMPEVEFTKLRRDFTLSASTWILRMLMIDDYRFESPVIYVQRGDALVKTTLHDIAISELRQLELDEDDERQINYTDTEKLIPDDEHLRQNSWT